MPYADVNGVRLYYETAGSGPPLLYISGTGSDLRNTPRPFDAPGAGDFTMTAYDQRCMGRSTRPDDIPAMTDFADDAAALLDHLGWDQVPVIGISFGGMVAQQLAIHYPDRVSRLVLGCTSSGGAGGSSYPLHELSDTSPEDYARTTMRLANNRRDDAWQAQNPARAAEVLDMYLTRARRNREDPTHRDAMNRQLAARRHHDVYDRLGGLDMPVLVCAGRYDDIAPPARSEAIAAAIPGARLRVFDGGHLFFMDDADAWPAIYDFLRE